MATIVTRAGKGSPLTNAEVDANFTNLDTAVTTLEGSVNTLSGDVTALDGEVTTLSGNVTTVQGTVATLSGNLTTLEGSVTTLSGNLTTLDGEVTTLSGNLTTLDGEVTTLSGTVTTVQGSVTTLSGNLTTLEGTVTTLSGDLTTLEGTVAGLGTMSAQDADAVAITGGSAALDSLVVIAPVKILGTGVTGFTPFAQTMQAWQADENNYQLIYTRNLNNGSDASSDFVAYNDASDLDSYFVDMGMNSSNFSSVIYPIFTPNSGYLFTGGGTSGQASDLFIGTSNPDSDIIFFTGGVDTTDRKAKIAGDTGNLLLNTDTDTGHKLNVNGTAFIGGATTFGDAVVLDADPTTDLQAATKQYVDAAVSAGLHVHTPVLVATTGNLTAAYSNGTAGVGATLTNSGTQAAIAVDGVSLAVNDRVLVWQQSAAAQNGVYVVTTVGSGSTNWVLTRSDDTDGYGGQDPNALGGGDYFFVESGNTQAAHAFICTNDATITFGTTSITFALFSSAPAYVAQSPLLLDGQTFSLDGVVNTAHGGTGTGTVAVGDLLYGSALNTWGKLTLSTAYKSLVINATGTQVEWNAVALNQAAAVSGQLGLGNGGTGASTAQAAMNTFAGAVTAGSYLRGNGTNVVMSGIQAADVPTLNQNTTGSAATLATARTLTIGSTGKTFNGSADVTWSLAEIGAYAANNPSGYITSADSCASATNATNLNGSGTISSTTTATTQAVGTANTTVATTAFVDRLRALGVSTTTGTAVIADRGGLIPITAGMTIPASVFAAGDTFTLYNNTAGNLTVTQGAGLTLRQVGTANTGNRTLAQRGLVTVVFISATEAVISGGGLT